MGQPHTQHLERRYQLSDHKVEVVSGDLVKVGCTDVTRAEVEDILARMKVFDSPEDRQCWRRLENSSTNSLFESAVMDCLADLRSMVRELQMKLEAATEKLR